MPGLPGLGVCRLLDAGHGLWVVVADAPLPRFGEVAIQHGLRNQVYNVVKAADSIFCSPERWNESGKAIDHRIICGGVVHNQHLDWQPFVFQGGNRLTRIAAQAVMKIKAGQIRAVAR